MGKPLISVIVPVYNVAPFLAKCIRSILEQTYKNIELILIDDDSSDNSLEICQYFASTDPRVVVMHKANGGPDSARKVGMERANGDYIGYVDSDDWIEPRMYEVLYKHAIEAEVSVVESGVLDYWDYAGTETKRHVFLPEGVYKDKVFYKLIEPYLLYSGDFFQHGVFPYLVTKLFKKEAIYPFQMMEDPSKNLVDDTMCTFPTIDAAASLCITHEAFYHYRVRIDSAKRESRQDVPQIVQLCYPEWIHRFRQSKDIQQMQKQIDYFTMYLLLFKAPYVFDDYAKQVFLRAYGEIEMDSHIVLYGAGPVGIQLYNYILKINPSSIVYWADKNYVSLSQNLQVGNPKDILNKQYDYIIISILRSDAAMNAKAELISMGIPSNKIRWIRDEYILKPSQLLQYAVLKGKAIF